jgi:uncharacterized ParB-like nuclease family protein
LQVSKLDPKEPVSRTVPVESIAEMEETAGVRSHRLDLEHAARMVPFIGDLPPIDVVALQRSRYGVLAGYHRLKAHQLAERKTIKVSVHNLDPEQWFAFAVRSNVTHGLPLTLAERKAAACQMLYGGDKRTDRAIAADCGLDHKTVAKLRIPREAESGGEDPHLEPTVRIGRDGKAYPVAGAVKRDEEHDEEPPREGFFEKLMTLEQQIRSSEEQANFARDEVAGESEPPELAESGHDGEPPGEPDPRAELAALERVIDRGIPVITDVIAAVERIRDNHLYKARDVATWEEYCRQFDPQAGELLRAFGRS